MIVLKTLFFGEREAVQGNARQYNTIRCDGCREEEEEEEEVKKYMEEQRRLGKKDFVQPDDVVSRKPALLFHALNVPMDDVLVVELTCRSVGVCPHSTR